MQHTNIGSRHKKLSVSRALCALTCPPLLDGFVQQSKLRWSDSTFHFFHSLPRYFGQHAPDVPFQRLNVSANLIQRARRLVLVTAKGNFEANLSLAPGNPVSFQFSVGMSCLG